MDGKILKKRSEDNPVEIIVLCQNDLNITRNFLNTLYSHTDDFSIIMIDNGSSDGSAKMLKTFAEDKDNMTLVRNDEDLGCIGGRNQGYEISCNLEPQSKFICFLDNDQFVGPGWLDKHLKVMDRGYDIVGAEAWLIHPATYLPVRHNDSLSQEFSYVGCGGMLIKRSVIEDIGLFDEDFGKNFYEDPDCCFRAYYSGYKIGWNFKHNIVHKQQSSVQTSDEKRKRFLASYEKFKKKWQGHTVPRLKQENIW